jgi:hypothetical protein
MGFPGGGLSDDEDGIDAAARGAGHARHRSAGDADPLGQLTEGEGATPRTSRAATPTTVRRPSTAGDALTGGGGAASKLASPPPAPAAGAGTPTQQQQPPPGVSTPGAGTPGRGGGGSAFGAVLTLPDMLLLRERAAGTSFSSHSSAGSGAGGSRASTAPSLGTGTGSLTGSMWGDVPDALTRYKTAASLWELDFDEIEIIRKIGEGSFGEVLLGNFRGTKVAVKRLHPLDGDASSCGSGSGAGGRGSGAAPGASHAAFKQFFEREIAILASIRHPNVRRGARGGGGLSLKSRLLEALSARLTMPARSRKPPQPRL